MPYREPYAGDPGQPAGQQLLAQRRHGLPLAVQFEEAGEVFGGVREVAADEVALPLGGGGGFVVEPDRRAEPAYGAGLQRYGVAGRVSEVGGDFPQAGVEAGPAGDVGLGDVAASAGHAAGVVRAWGVRTLADRTCADRTLADRTGTVRSGAVRTLAVRRRAALWAARRPAAL